MCMFEILFNKYILANVNTFICLSYLNILFHFYVYIILLAILARRLQYNWTT